MMFVSDLDHTLIYSKRDLNGEKAVPVEYIGEKPITYIQILCLLLARFEIMIKQCVSALFMIFFRNL